ncbi:MAG: hypothetical protein NWE93_08585 [Candidatus Bathyarchaeota archaeon]|nr:hypothetical protein [Candidatus Bathyarchaeota archaeon]
MDYLDELKLEEYRNLQEEHRRNRSYIFDRPILILGVVSVVLQYFLGSTLSGFLAASVIFILTFNMWFIANRLRSDGRIVAYILLVHEGEYNSKWFGWESTLRIYRQWKKRHSKLKDANQLIAKKLEPENIPDANAFYPAIRLLHIFLVSLMVIISIVIWYTNQTALAAVQLATISAATCLFSYYVGWPLRPAKIRSNIEEYRAMLLCVFDEFYTEKTKITKNQTVLSAALPEAP